MKKGLVITVNSPDVVYEPKRIIEEGKNFGVEVDWLFYEDFSLVFDNGFKIYNKGIDVDFSDYGWAIPRSSVVGVGHNHSDLKTFLVDEMVKKGVKVTNDYAFLRWMNFSKLTQYYYFAARNIPHVKSEYMATLNSKKLGLKFPMIAKNTLGSLGKGVHKVSNENDLSDIVNQYTASRVLMQEFLTTGQDYRVLVVGNKPVGAMRRIAPEGSHISNISSGGKAEEAELTEEMIDISMKVKKLFKLDLCGVDIMFDKNGNPYVLEVNRHPQFQGFEGSSNKNVARELVVYLNESSKKTL